MSDILEKLNHFVIDWCYQCAATAYRETDKKHQSFTYQLIQFARTLDPKTGYGFFSTELSRQNSYIFMLKPGSLKSFTGDETVQKYKNRASFYKGFFPILEEHLKNCGDDRIRKFRVSLDKKEGNLSVCIE